MLKTKKVLSTLIASVMLASSIGINAMAEDYVYPDTTDIIDGVEVVKVGVEQWTPNYQGNGSATLYTTHEAYEGNGAMLIAAPPVGTTAFPANANLTVKVTSENYADRIIHGDSYKITLYQKPTQPDDNGNYYIFDRARYYNSYDIMHANIYDAETNELFYPSSNQESKTYENKWYRCEWEFVANGGDTGTGGQLGDVIGFALTVDGGNKSVLADNLSVSHLIDGEWVVMSDGTSYKNGDFEENVTAVRGVNPTGVYAEAGDGTVTIHWTNPQEQETGIYNGSELMVTVEAGETSATVDGLENDTAYTFTLKGVLNGIESSGVDVSFTPHEEVWQYSDTIATVAGVEVFKSNQSSNTNLQFPNWQSRYQQGTMPADNEIYLTHDAYKGSAAMLVKGSTIDTYDVTNTGLNKVGSINNSDKMIEGDTYKIELYQKPVERGTDGKYKLCTSYRYYDNYSLFELTAYDPETNLPADLNNLESKWYRLEREFVAIASDVSGNNGGLAIWNSVNSPAFLVDAITMYHKVGDEWIAMSDGTAVSNGDFESGVENVFGLDPIDVRVENKTESVVLSWTNPQDQQTNIYNGDDLVMTAEAGVSSVTITDLTGDVEYTFTLKGAGKERESEGVSVTAFPYKRLADTTDIILGIEVFQTGAPHWLTSYQEVGSSIYLTHEAYDGNAALLIVPPENAWSFPSNNELNKNFENYTDTDKILAGDTYKIIWYAKPVQANADGVYQIPTRHRYYDDYAENAARVYDAQTGEEIIYDNVATNGMVTVENKWYRLETEFVASALNATSWVGFGLRVVPGAKALLIDNLQMYHLVDGEWMLMQDSAGVRNGNFEEGIVGDDTAPYEVENFRAVAGDAQAQLSWDKVDVNDLAGYTIWNGSEKIADLDRTATSYTVTGLTNDTEYTFIIRAYDRFGNSSEGTPVSVTPITPEYEIGEFNMGQTIVSGTNSVSVSVKNNKKADGLNAQLILGLYDKASNTLVKAAASEVVTTAVGESNTLTATLSVEDLNAADYELKAFLWESLDSVSPLTAGASIGE